MADIKRWRSFKESRYMANPLRTRENIVASQDQDFFGSLSFPCENVCSDQTTYVHVPVHLNNLLS